MTRPEKLAVARKLADLGGVSNDVQERLGDVEADREGGRQRRRRARVRPGDRRVGAARGLKGRGRRLGGGERSEAAARCCKCSQPRARF